MDVKDKTDYWLDLAEYDIEVCKSLLQSKKFLYVGFFCHLIVEKSLKAYFWFKLKAEPPFTHNLYLLAEKTLLINSLNETQTKLLRTLIPLNIEGRYPTDKQILINELSEQKVNEIFLETIEFNKWLKTLIIY